MCHVNNNGRYICSCLHGFIFEKKVFDGAINLTLQAAADILVESLNDLALNGLPIPSTNEVGIYEKWTFYSVKLFLCENAFCGKYPPSFQVHPVTVKFFVMSFKGDWKYLKQLFNLDRHPSTEKAGLAKIVTCHDSYASLLNVSWYVVPVNFWMLPCRSAGNVKHQKARGTWIWPTPTWIPMQDGGKHSTVHCPGHLSQPWQDWLAST